MVGMFMILRLAGNPLHEISYRAGARERPDSLSLLLP